MTEKRLTTKMVAEGGIINIPEGVDIIDSTPHGTGTKLTLLEPKGEYECGEPTTNGETCSRTVEYPTDTCHQH